MIISGELQKNARREISKIYPAGNLEIRKTEIMSLMPNAEKKKIRKKKEEGRRETEKKDLQSMAQGLAGQEFTLKAKATDEAKLFGSISPGVVTQELLRKGYTVEESAVALEENIKECGTYTVQLKFPHGVTAQIKLSVTKEE